MKNKRKEAGGIIMKTWNRKELKEKAKLRLKANYWKAVLVGLLAVFVGGGSSAMSGVTSGMSSAESSNMAGSAFADGIGQIPVAGIIAMTVFLLILFVIIFVIAFALQILLVNPLEVGRDRFFYRDLSEDADIKEVCYAFDRGYKNSVKVMFFRDLYTMLWSLLFIIPGIVKSYEYRMIPYLLSENPNMDKQEAFAMSRQMMNGNKWDAFVLDLSFILWDILGACTFGILHIFYIEPYKRLTDAGLYQALKEGMMTVKTEYTAAEPVVAEIVEE